MEITTADSAPPPPPTLTHSSQLAVDWKCCSGLLVSTTMWSRLLARQELLTNWLVETRVRSMEGGGLGCAQY